jgi:hypothetical protein
MKKKLITNKEIITKRPVNYEFQYYDDCNRLIHRYTIFNGKLFGFRLRKYYI